MIKYINWKKRILRFLAGLPVLVIAGYILIEIKADTSAIMFILGMPLVMVLFFSIYLNKKLTKNPFIIIQNDMVEISNFPSSGSIKVAISGIKKWENNKYKLKIITTDKQYIIDLNHLDKVDRDEVIKFFNENINSC